MDKARLLISTVGSTALKLRVLIPRNLTELIAKTLKQKGITDENTNELSELRLDLWQIIRFLRLFNLIDKPAYKKLTYIGEKRNRMAHYPLSYQQSSMKKIYRN